MAPEALIRIRHKHYNWTVAYTDKGSNTKLSACVKGAVYNIRKPEQFSPISYNLNTSHFLCIYKSAVAFYMTGSFSVSVVTTNTTQIYDVSQPFFKNAWTILKGMADDKFIMQYSLNMSASPIISGNDSNVNEQSVCCKMRHFNNTRLLQDSPVFIKTAC